MTFEQALAAVKADPTILQHEVSYHSDRGRCIYVETDQGWNPCAVWQEIYDDYNPLNDY